MTTALVPMDQLTAMANAFAKSGMFGAKTPEQCLALLLLASAENIHPALAMRDFDVIQGRPAKKAEAMLRSFIGAGGRVEWHSMTDDLADATFSHEQGGTARITWDMARATKAGLSGKDNYKKFPRQMLANRVISEGCRRIYPASTSGLYEPGEVRDMAEPEGERFKKAKDVTPKAPPLNAPVDPGTGEIVTDWSAELASADTLEALQAVWKRVPKEEKPGLESAKNARKDAIAAGIAEFSAAAGADAPISGRVA